METRSGLSDGNNGAGLQLQVEQVEVEKGDITTDTISNKRASVLTTQRDTTLEERRQTSSPSTRLVAAFMDDNVGLGTQPTHEGRKEGRGGRGEAERTEGGPFDGDGNATKKREEI